MEVNSGKHPSDLLNTKSQEPNLGMQKTIKLLTMHSHLPPERLEMSKQFCLLFNGTWRIPWHPSPRDAHTACFFPSHN